MAPKPNVINYPAIVWEDLHIEAITHTIEAAQAELKRRRVEALESGKVIDTFSGRGAGGWPLRPS